MGTIDVLLKEKILARKNLEITFVVALYWTTSLSLVFINKHLLSTESAHFNAPLFITLFQCLCTIILYPLINKLHRFDLKLLKFLSFPQIHFHPHKMKKVLPLSLIFVGMITFNNLCLKYVGIAFYFVGRSLTSVFNIILTYIILHQTTSLPAFICCLIIITGFILGTDQEEVYGSLSFLGVLFGLLASLFVSLNSIYTKSILSEVDNNVWLLTFYNNINAVILLTFLSIFTGELQVIIYYDHTFNFWLMMIFSGLFAIGISITTSLQIKVTSPLTHNISGTAKACIQTILAVLWFHETKTLLWWISNFLVLIGSASYTRVKQLEMKKQIEFRLDPNSKSYLEKKDECESEKLISQVNKLIDV